jgi:hypothetical protein
MACGNSSRECGSSEFTSIDPSFQPQMLQSRHWTTSQRLQARLQALTRTTSL